MSPLRSSKIKDSKLDYCPRCAALLCKRVYMHQEQMQERVIHIKHRGYEVLCFGAIVCCPHCRTWIRVDPVKGLLGIQKDLMVESMKEVKAG